MTFNFTSFGDDVVWVFAIQFFILAAALLIGNILRRKVPFFRKSLMPSALIGGTLILLLKLIPGFKDLINQSGMEIVTYHCLAIGFIALALKRGKEQNKAPVKTILETGVLQGAVYSMQAVVGLIVTIILCVTLGFFPGGGVLLALGFGQGTGQALNFGSSFENQYGFAGGATFGLTIATVGFFVACIVGVVYMNILRRRGKLKIITDKSEDEKLSDYISENEIPRAESVDRLTINLGLVFLVYGLVYLVMRLVNVSLVWGFNFLLGSIFAMLCKLVLNQFRKRGLMHREIVNDYLLDRISGLAFDTMIIAGVAAINLDDLSNMWWQLCIICALGTVTTFVYIRLAANELYKGYEHEAFFSLFGMLTGTASNGVILLREIDPSFETPAASNLVLSGVPAIAFGGALLLVLDYCPRGLTESIVSLSILTVGFIVFTLILFRRSLFKKKKKEAAPAENEKE
ncbi:MAG: hypothetical protein IJY71_02225 [Clostridia bacterium]|nr:hypothetical protein [Clostridia bacterium]